MKQTILPRGLRRHNPGNIRITADRFVGEIHPSADPAFKQFRTLAYGYRAMFVILGNYNRLYGLHTIRGIITRWAPPQENDTAAYIAAVSKLSGISPDEPIPLNDRRQMTALVAAISQVENGCPADLAEVAKGWEMWMGGPSK